jgi:outer membrane protein insertion porin family
LALAPGETFTSALAAEDFARVAAVYAEAGYLIDAQPNFSYLDGTYVQRITELRIAEYRVIFENETHRTQDFVVTRYLPAVGSVLNQNELRNALITLARQGVVEPLAFPLEPTGTPGEVIVNVTVRERPTGQFGPEATYDTNRGFAANLSFSDSNFLGRAHNISASLSAQTSDVGFLLGASVEYSIPWLYLDAYDFQQVPTSLSGSLFSVIETNQTMTAGRRPVPTTSACWSASIPSATAAWASAWAGASSPTPRSASRRGAATGRTRSSPSALASLGRTATCSTLGFARCPKPRPFPTSPRVASRRR